jgi:hypothetical protein
MTYLLVDPQTFLLADNADQQATDQFLVALVKWSQASDDYDITFALTQECAEALRTSPRSIFNPQFLAELSQRYPNIDIDAVLKIAEPLYGQLQSQHQLDDTLQALEDGRIEYELNDVWLSPVEHYDRLSSEWLREKFKRMLGLVAFARNQGIVPLAALEDVRVLTTYTAEEIRHWAAESAYKLLVHVRFTWLLDKSIENHDQVERVRKFDDEFETLWTHEKATELPRRERLTTLMDAVHLAERKSGGRLVATSRTEQSARHSGHNPRDIYEVLCALIDVWLPVAKQMGENEASQRFRESTGYRIVEMESLPTNRDPKLRAEREVTYNGKTIYCRRHVRMGSGPGGARIYFEYLKQEGRIILAGVGKHAPTSRDRT